MTPDDLLVALCGGPAEASRARARWHAAARDLPTRVVDVTGLGSRPFRLAITHLDPLAQHADDVIGRAFGALRAHAIPARSEQDLAASWTALVGDLAAELAHAGITTPGELERYASAYDPDLNATPRDMASRGRLQPLITVLAAPRHGVFL